MLIKFLIYLLYLILYTIALLFIAIFGYIFTKTLLDKREIDKKVKNLYFPE
jgi:hypothetical protein